MSGAMDTCLCTHSKELHPINGEGTQSKNYIHVPDPNRLELIRSLRLVMP